VRSKLIYFLSAIIIADLVFLNYSFFSKNKFPPNIPATSTPDLSALTAKISQLESAVTTLQSVTPIPTLTVPRIPTAPISRHVNYLPINGAFNQLSYDWIDVPTSDFYFDTGDYPGLISVNFEANMKLFNGNGLAFARLYDVTHAAPIPGSQVQTGSQQDSMVTSSPLTFLTGHNLIRVQIKSLTADTTYFNSGRLIITSKY